MSKRSNQISQEKQDKLVDSPEFREAWKGICESSDFHVSIEIAFNDFKDKHSTGNTIPHLHQHNQTSINAVREFVETYINLGINYIPEEKDNGDESDFA